MSGYREEFFSKKSKVLESLKSAETFLCGNGYEEDAGKVSVQRKNLESGEFSIALVGEFSAGKSTFLNAMMGERILPSFTRETTATINFLRHTEKAKNGEKGCVYYKDGRKQILDRADRETINRYVSTDGENVVSTVDHVDLFLDSRFLKDNVMLVDTPGLNGIAKGHKEATQSQIERSSAGIFLFDAHQPGSRTNFEVLTALSKRVGNILLVLNQIDTINDWEKDSVEGVVESLKKSYRELYPDAKIPEIWPVSAYEALVARSKKEDLPFGKRQGFSAEEKEKMEKESRMGEFEERLWKFLTRGEKTQQMLLTPITQTIGILTAIKDRNMSSIDALNGKIDTVANETKIMELEKAIADLESREEEIRKDFKGDVKQKEKEFIEAVNAGSERFREEIVRKIDNFTDIEEIMPDSLENMMKRKLQEISADAWDDYINAMRDVMGQHCQSITEDINNMLDTANLEIRLDGQLNLPEVDLGLEKYEKEKKRLEEEKAALERQQKAADINWAEEMVRQNKIEELQEKIKHEQDKKETMEQNRLMMAPKPQWREREVQQTVSRGGILGGIATFLFGEKQVIKMESFLDREALDAYNRQCQQVADAADRRISKLEAALAAVGSANAEQKKRLAESLEKERQRKAEELRQYREDAAKDFKRKNEVQLKKQKEAAKNFLEDLLWEFVKGCKKNFDDQRKALQAVIADGVRFSVSQKIEQTKKELEHLKKVSETAVNDRDAELAKCEQENESILGMLNELMNIQSDLENVGVDTIRVD